MKTLENTAFMGNLALHFPDFFGKYYDEKPQIQELIKWAFDFVNKTNLYDDTTQEMLNFVSKSN